MDAGSPRDTAAPHRAPARLTMTYVYGIGMSSGEQLPISNALKWNREQLDAKVIAWACDPSREKVVRALADDGFDSFLVAQGGTAELARAAMAATLRTAGVLPEEIDAVMISTESFWDTEGTASLTHVEEHLRLRQGLLRVIADLGLAQAVPYANWMASCANFGSALTLARALVVTQNHRRVLLAFADRVPPWEPRVMRSGAAVLSDLAVACVLGPERRGFEVKAVVSCAAAGVASFDLSVNSPRELFDVMLDTRRALARLERQFESVTGRRLSSFETIVAGHFHPYTLKIMCDALGIRTDCLLRQGRARYAHAFASDNLVTLATLDSEGAFEIGQDIILLNSGVWCWSLIWLTKVSPE